MDLQTMRRSLSSENDDNISPSSQQQQHMIDSNTLTLTRESRTNTTVASELNDLSSPPQQQQHYQQPSTPKTILRSLQPQVATGGGGKTVTIHSQPEIIQLQSNTSPSNALSNPCYFASLNDTMDQYDIEQHTDNRVVISIRGAHNSIHNNHNNNNNSNYMQEDQKEATKF